MITLNCPDCDRQYELEDTMAGKKAACQCGAILFVPKTVDAPPGEKICPQCSSSAKEESVICIKCGYNFQTGGKLRTEKEKAEPEEDQKSMFIRSMIKPCIFLIIACVAALIVYNTFFKKSYGISSADPIGTLTAINAHLKKYGYVKQNITKSYIPKQFKNDATKIIWKDVKLEKASKGMYSESIFIIVSPDNKILAIGANFKGAVASIPGDTGSKTGHFMTSLWKEVGFPFPPDFQSIEKGEGKFSYTIKKAEESLNDLHAIWMEYPSDVSVLPSSQTMLISYSRFGEDLTYKKMQGAISYHTSDLKKLKSSFKIQLNK